MIGDGGERAKYPSTSSTSTLHRPPLPAFLLLFTASVTPPSLLLCSILITLLLRVLAESWEKSIALRHSFITDKASTSFYLNTLHTAIIKSRCAETRWNMIPFNSKGTLLYVRTLSEYKMTTNTLTGDVEQSVLRLLLLWHCVPQGGVYFSVGYLFCFSVL